MTYVTNGESEMLSKKLTTPYRAFMSWTRSVAMWAVWNVPLGRWAPAWMGYAMQSKPVLSRIEQLERQAECLTQGDNA